MVEIHGASLTGLAAAARLARLGHAVQLSGAVNSPWLSHAENFPPVVLLPALWRDFFTKTGRPAAGTLGSRGLTMMEAPPATYLLPSGEAFTLPVERGAQFHAMAGRWGTPAANAWRQLIDDLGAVWMAWRRYGVENVDVPSSKTARAALRLDVTVSDLANRLPHPDLAALLLSAGHRSGSDSPKAPALVATRFYLERTFGRWQLLGEGLLAPAYQLAELVQQRATERGVRFTDAPSTRPDIDASPYQPHGSLFRRSPRAALAPLVTHSDASNDEATEVGVHETVDLTGHRPRITWRYPTAAGIRVLTHDYSTAQPNLAWGLAPDNARAWLRRPVVAGEPLYASICSPAGNEPWSELATGALAAYEIHRRLTGEDPSPRNKDFRPPPNPRPGS